MEKKKIFILFSIIIIVLVSGIYIYSGFSNSSVKIGDVEFYLPQGYHEGSLNELGAINITNGNSSVFIYENEDNETLKYTSHYINSPTQKNQKIDIINYTIDDVLVYRTDNKNASYKVHYWFIKNNKTYDIYTWDGNEDIENIVIKFIRS